MPPLPEKRTPNLPSAGYLDEVIGHTTLTGVRKTVRVPVAALQRQVAEGLEAGVLTFLTLAEANANLAYGDKMTARVVADPVAANNGYYRKVGPSGAGNWTRSGDLPYQVIACTDAGAGTANAIQLTSFIPAPVTPGAALFSFKVFETNTGAVTVSLNGAADKDLVTVSNGAIGPGYLTAGMIAVFADDGAKWRLLTDVASAAVLAAAEADRIEVLGYRNEVLAAVGAIRRPVVDSYAAMRLLNTIDVTIGGEVYLKTADAWGGRAEGSFIALTTAEAIAQGVNADDGAIMVKNSANDLVFVRPRWLDERAANVLWWKPSHVPGVDSGAALETAFNRIRTLAATADAALIVPRGRSFESGRRLNIGSNFKLLGQGWLKAHSTLAQNVAMVGCLVVSGTLGTYQNKNIEIDVNLDGGNRVFTDSPTRQGLMRLDSVEDLKIGDIKACNHQASPIILAGVKDVTAGDIEIYNFGYPGATAGSGQDGGPSLYIGSNFFDGTTSKGIRLGRIYSHDGNWCGPSINADDVQVTALHSENVKETGLFCRDLTTTVPFPVLVSRFIQVVNPIIRSIGQINNDGNGVTIGARKFKLIGGQISETHGPGLSIVTEAGDVQVSGTSILNVISDPAYYGSIEADGAITIRDGTTDVVSPTRIAISKIDIRDQRGTKLTPWAVRIERTGASVNAITDISITDCDLEESCTNAAVFKIDPAIVGTRWEISRNRGAPEWKRHRLPIFGNTFAAIGAPTNPVSLTPNGNVLAGMAFDQSAISAAVSYFSLPDNMFENKVYVRIYSTAPSGNGPVVWGLSANAFGHTDTLDVAFAGNVNSAPVTHNTNILSVSPFIGPITINNAAQPGDLACLRLGRITTDPGDTHSGLAQALYMDIMYSENGYSEAILQAI